ncbi:hypothetical protein GE061_011552 [Apolygus lucorum]|uniref:Uncharacterized protein n=1 Tax=Apolygus lucorum TaxID=248454 RepID=A0A6A4K285_APOLU|nr:hypothetical protein GE061_011552 [Apolygus lucorum]
MSFFVTEKVTSRAEREQIGHRKNDNLLPQREFTLGNLQSGLQKSPYELFRENVAKYCDRYMMESFEPRDCMSAEEKASLACRNCTNNSSGLVCDRYTESPQNHKISAVCDEINDIPIRDPSSTTTNNTNACFSVLSVSFEPLDKGEPNKKMSFLERISKLMNTYNSNKVAFTQHAELKQLPSPHSWSACECHVHIGKHSNCCQCQEPYHRTRCDCVQHSGSHSYCCRCDIQLLQQYDQFLRKKKYLRLYNVDDDVSSPNSTSYLNPMNPSRPSTSQTEKSAWCEDRGLFTQEFLNDNKRYSQPGVSEFPKENNDFQTSNSEKSYLWKRECDVAQSENGEDHPCESCCKKLDDVYGSALREVHSMLLEVSRSLSPPINCCTLDALIKDTLLRRNSLHNSSICSQERRKSSQMHEPPESERVSYPLEEIVTFPRILNRQSDAAVQVNTYSQESNLTPEEKRSNNRNKRKLFKKGKLKEMCTLS